MSSCKNETMRDIYNSIITFEKSSDLNVLLKNNDVINKMPIRYFNDLKYRSILLGIIIGLK
jgi:hypothetical protein